MTARLVGYALGMVVTTRRGALAIVAFSLAMAGHASGAASFDVRDFGADSSSPIAAATRSKERVAPLPIAARLSV